MLTMRRATPDDQGPLEELVIARGQWMIEQGLYGGDAWQAAARDLAEQAADERGYVWVLLDGERVIGRTSAYSNTPSEGWTDVEQAESAIFLATSVTDPAYRRQQPGRLMALWMLDHAARSGIEWVRRGTSEEGLLRYYRDVQGWELKHAVPHGERTVYMLGRRAESVPELPVLMAGTAALV